MTGIGRAMYAGLRRRVSQQMEFALIVDDVLELASIPLQEITPPVSAGVGLDHVQGVSPGGTVIIDVESLSSDRRLRVHEELQ